MLGIALGVTALIVVLSVMNGFQTELRGQFWPWFRMCRSAGPTVIWPTGKRLPLSASEPRVLAAAPYVQEQAMLSFD